MVCRKTAQTIAPQLWLIEGAASLSADPQLDTSTILNVLKFFLLLRCLDIQQTSEWNICVSIWFSNRVKDYLPFFTSADWFQLALLQNKTPNQTKLVLLFSTLVCTAGKALTHQLFSKHLLIQGLIDLCSVNKNTRLSNDNVKAKAAVCYPEVREIKSFSFVHLISRSWSK